MHIGGGRRGVTSFTSSKDFERFGHKNAIKHENRGPPSPRCSNSSRYPLKRI